MMPTLGLHYSSVMDNWEYKEYDNEGNIVGQGHRRIYVHMYYNSAQAEADKAGFFSQLSKVSQALLQGGCTEQQQAMADAYLHVHTTPVRGYQNHLRKHPSNYIFI
jgi:hypothetical protein